MISVQGIERTQRDEQQYSRSRYCREEELKDLLVVLV
jgi:hypothetical protein